MRQIELPNGVVVPFPDKGDATDADYKRLDELITKTSSQKDTSAFQGNFGPPPAFAGPPGAFTQHEQQGGFAVPKVPEIAKQTALPIAGQVGGRALGSRVGFPRAGEAFGGFMGEGANQLLGITEPSKTQLALAAGLPVAGRGLIEAKRGAKFLRKFVGPASQAKILNELGPEEAALVINRYTPKNQAGKLFEMASKDGTVINTTETFNWLSKNIIKLNSLSKGAKPTKVINTMQALREKIAASSFVDPKTGKKIMGLTPAELQGELEAFGDLLHSMKRSGKVGAGSIEKTFERLMTDLDNATDVAGASSLKLARATFKRSKAVKEIENAIEKSTKLGRGQGDVTQFNANQVIQDLKKNRFFKSAFSPEEQADIFSLFHKLNEIPALPPGAGATFGSGPIMSAMRPALVAGGVGGAIGTVVGNPVLGGTLGFAAGAVIPPADRARRMFSLAMQFETGRALLKNMLSEGGQLTPNAMAMLSQFLRVKLSEADKPGGSP